MLFSYDGSVKAAEPNWTATFYPKINFTGPAITKSYSSLNLNWGANSPDKRIPKDNFSAVFEKKVTITTPGLYKFTGKADDGLQIYLDGKKRVVAWSDGIHSINQNIYLTAGIHSIKIQYYEHKWSAGISVDLQKAPESFPADSWTAEFYPSPDFTGTPVKKTYQKLEFSYGSGSPSSLIPRDHYSGVFRKQVYVSASGWYTLSGKADDGVRIYIDGKNQVDFWRSGVHPFSQKVNLSPGNHSILIEYYDDRWSSSFSFDLVKPTETIPTDKWLANFYPSQDFSGNPITNEYKDIHFSWGGGSPDPHIPTDKFSATFVRKYVIDKPGKYRFVGQADDGVKISVDGTPYVDLWKDGVNTINSPINLTAGTHTVTVEYYDGQYSALLCLDLIQDSWNANFFPTDNLTGTPIHQTYDTMNFSWGGSPISSIPADHFSAVFEKQVFIPKSTNYQLSGKADDGIRIYIDGVQTVNIWKVGVNYYSNTVNLARGLHSIKIEYYDNLYYGSLSFNLAEAIKQVITQYTNYNLSLSTLLTKEIGISQTDKKYEAYIQDAALTVNASTPNVGNVNSAGWNVRGLPVTGWVLGKTNANEKVTIYSKTPKQSDGHYWYKISYNRTWVNPSPTDINYYINPSNFNLGNSSYYQFLNLSHPAGVDANEVNQKILANKGILTGKGQVFINAGIQFGINEIYLISHSLLETGNGTSPLATGIKVKKKIDSKGNPVYDPDTGEMEITELPSNATNFDSIVYNMYGIGAFDSCPYHCGARKAFNEGWTTPDKAILGGAAFVSTNYIQKGQDTLYKMKWNPVYPGAHQYATDIGWAVKQTPTIYNLYSLLDSYTIVFDVPKFNY